jgi:3-oxoadipate enol-lactonase
VTPPAGYADLNGGHHAFDDTGDGAAVVFIPGFTLDMRMWEPQLAAFAARFRVIRYDLRGAGRSAPPDGPYAFHDDLRALLDAREIRAAHVIGLSLGGSIAVDFALAYPERTRSLVAVGTSALGGFPWPPELKALFAGLTAAANGPGGITAAKERWLAAAWFAPAMRDPAVAAALRAIQTDYSGWHFNHRDPVRRLDPPANARLHEIAAPTFVVAGELDLPFHNLPIAERLAEAIPGAQKLLLPGVGHVTNMEDPDRFNAAVLSFLDRVEGHHGT